jgi:succinate-acetate transporter protein
VARSRATSTIDLSRDHATADGTRTGPDRVSSIEDFDAWYDRSRIVLSPIAAPSILGLFGFFTATIMVGTNLAGWWGGDLSSLSFFPFALIMGGVAQLLAAMWSYKARDGLATAVHGTWGSFWTAWGILQLLYATGVEVPLPLGTVNVGLAIWFVPLCAITMSAALASLGESLGLFTVLAALAGGSGIFAGGLWAGSLTAEHVAGWFFVVSAAAAWYVASAMMMVSATGRTVLPLGKWSKAANVPFDKPIRPIEYPFGDPGVKVGQ